MLALQRSSSFPRYTGGSSTHFTSKFPSIYSVNAKKTMIHTNTPQPKKDLRDVKIEGSFTPLEKTKYNCDSVMGSVPSFNIPLCTKNESIELEKDTIQLLSRDRKLSGVSSASTECADSTGNIVNTFDNQDLQDLQRKCLEELNINSKCCKQVSTNSTDIPICEPADRWNITSEPLLLLHDMDEKNGIEIVEKYLLDNNKYTEDNYNENRIITDETVQHFPQRRSEIQRTSELLFEKESLTHSFNKATHKVGEMRDDVAVNGITNRTSETLRDVFGSEIEELKMSTLQESNSPNMDAKIENKLKSYLSIGADTDPSLIQVKCINLSTNKKSIPSALPMAKSDHHSPSNSDTQNEEQYSSNTLTPLDSNNKPIILTRHVGLTLPIRKRRGMYCHERPDKFDNLLKKGESKNENFQGIKRSASETCKTIDNSKKKQSKGNYVFEKDIQCTITAQETVKSTCLESSFHFPVTRPSEVAITITSSLFETPKLSKNKVLSCLKKSQSQEPIEKVSCNDHSLVEELLLPLVLKNRKMQQSCRRRGQKQRTSRRVLIRSRCLRQRLLHRLE